MRHGHGHHEQRGQDGAGHRGSQARAESAGADNKYGPHRHEIGDEERPEIHPRQELGRDDGARQEAVHQSATRDSAMERPQAQRHPEGEQLLEMAVLLEPVRVEREGDRCHHGGRRLARGGAHEEVHANAGQHE